MTWNISHRRNVAIWEYLDGLQPDVALVQEAVPPPGLDRVIYRQGGIGRNRPWGSAIVSYGPAMTEVTSAKSHWNKQEASILNTFPGSVVAATVEVAGGITVTMINVYAVIDNGYAVTTLHRILSDLVPLFDDRRYNRHVILAGDLNAGSQGPPEDPDVKRSAYAVARIRNDFDLVDCVDLKLGPTRHLPNCPCGAPECRHYRTQRHRGDSPVPWQNDYVFATPNLTDRLTSCQPLNGDDDPAWRLSDHCPIIAEFDL